MTKGIRNLPIIVAAIHLGGCAGHQEPIVGLYKSATCSSTSQTMTCGQPTAIATVVSNPPAPDLAVSPATLFPERAEAAYITALAVPRMSKDAKTLQAALAAPLKAPAPTQVDRRNITRNLTVTTSKAGSFNPDDRLEQTEVFIRLDPKVGKFTTWDNATTIYNSISAGTLQIASTRGGETDLALGSPSAAPVSASIGEKLTNSTTKTQTVNETIQAENLTVDVEEGGAVLRIRRQGGPGVDLTGNVAVRVGIALAGSDKVALYQVASLFDDNGKASDPTKLHPTRSLVDVGPKGPVKAAVTMRYVMRHVLTGGGSLAAGNQDVQEMIADAPPADALLAPLADAFPASFGIYRNGDVVPIAIKLPGLEADSLCFGSYDEAEALMRYLVLGKSTLKLGTANIGWSSVGVWTSLTRADLENLEVRSDCLP